jgi:hypothetical protein
MSIKEVVEHFRLLELEFWKYMGEEDLEYATYEGDLKPEEMLFYGEFAFALLGLKPNLLIDFRDKNMSEKFYDSVVGPTIKKFKIKNFKFHVIWELRSQDRRLTGCIVMYDKKKPIPEIDILLVDDGEGKRVPERTLGKILSYPGSFAQSDEEFRQFKSVVYYHQRPNCLVTITSFCILEPETEATLEHFRLHSTACKEQLDMDLKIEIR